MSCIEVAVALCYALFLIYFVLARFILYWLSDATHPGLSPVGQCWLHLCWHRRTKEPQRAREKTNSQILSRFCEHLDGFGLDHPLELSWSQRTSNFISETEESMVQSTAKPWRWRRTCVAAPCVHEVRARRARRAGCGCRGPAWCWP